MENGKERRGLVSLYPLNESAPRRLAESGIADKDLKKRPITEKDANGIKKVVMEMITDRISNGTFELDLGMIKDPKDRCDIVLKLMGFVLPKVSAIDVNGNLELDSVSDELSKLTRQVAEDSLPGKNKREEKKAS